ncbi:hypothetical protein K523DRAFT_323480 [Schizophyllum commune Tattone D]|nr:hypothetical protein K523DRAFT_323480 [Schizophyllum commune Tattone D]
MYNLWTQLSVTHPICLIYSLYCSSCLVQDPVSIDSATGRSLMLYSCTDLLLTAF